MLIIISHDCSHFIVQYGHMLSQWQIKHSFGAAHTLGGFITIDNNFTIIEMYNLGCTMSQLTTMTEYLYKYGFDYHKLLLNSFPNVKYDTSSSPLPAPDDSTLNFELQEEKV